MIRIQPNPNRIKSNDITKHTLNNALSYVDTMKHVNDVSAWDASKTAVSFNPDNFTHLQPQASLESLTNEKTAVSSPDNPKPQAKIEQYSNVNVSALHGLFNHSKPLSIFYFVLRHHDKAHELGSGRIELSIANKLLDRFVGSRQRETIFNFGNGLVWSIGKDWQGTQYLYFFSPKQICSNLGVDYQTKTLRLFDSVFSESKRMIVALFFDAIRQHYFNGKPVSRETIAKVLNVSASQQKRYDNDIDTYHYKKTGNHDHKQTNYVITDHEWCEDTAVYYRDVENKNVFHFIDYYGKQGKKGAEYIALHLPNSYVARFEAGHNDKIIDCNLSLDKLKTGNSTMKLFCDDVKQASKLSGKHKTTCLYPSQSSNDFTLWQGFTGI